MSGLNFTKITNLFFVTKNLPEKYQFFPKCLLGIIAFTVIMLGDALLGMIYGAKIPCLHELPQLFCSIGILLLVLLAGIKLKKAE